MEINSLPEKGREGSISEYIGLAELIACISDNAIKGFFKRTINLEVVMCINIYFKSEFLQTGCLRSDSCE